MTTEELAARLAQLTVENAGSGMTLETRFRQEIRDAMPLDDMAMIIADAVELSPAERAAYREQLAQKQQCVHCGGLHLRACRRVRRIIMRNAEEISEVEFWPDGSWDATGIIWPEDVYDDEETPSE